MTWNFNEMSAGRDANNLLPSVGSVLAYKVCCLLRPLVCRTGFEADIQNMRLTIVLVLSTIVLILSTPASAEKIPHIVPAPYNLEEYWEEIYGELPRPIARYLREFAEEGMPCRARGWARTRVEGMPQYDSRTVRVMQEFYGWEELDKFLATHTFRITFRWLLFQGDVVVRVARVDVEAIVTWSADKAYLERPITGTISENGHVIDLTDCCPVHE